MTQPTLTGMTSSPLAILCLTLFVLAYVLVIAEERLRLRKSIPVVIAAAVMWCLVGAAARGQEEAELARHAAGHYLLEFAELFLFLLAAMTFINTMEDRNVFRVLRSWLVSRRLSLRGIFWLTGLLSFFVSAIADNLTTALLMGAVVLSVGSGKPRFLSAALVNVVVAANAGGAFSPFGDITTLMVWQAGQVDFGQFFYLFVPSLVNWLVPAVLMSFALEPGQPSCSEERATLRTGAIHVVVLFLLTIATAVAMHVFFELPPVLGMMGGLGFLKLYGTGLQRGAAGEDGFAEVAVSLHEAEGNASTMDPQAYFDVFRILEKAEWDTLMFFYGVIMCVGALATLGYLTLLSHACYGAMGATGTNTFAGLLSAVVDNIPVMAAVLAMNPQMSLGQWLLVTLTAGVGGSLLSIGSAAGVALMGQAAGSYTMRSHLRWTWAIALGFVASIGAHLLLNRGLF